MIWTHNDVIATKGMYVIPLKAQANHRLTLKAVGFLVPIKHWGPRSVKFDPDILESWNLKG